MTRRTYLINLATSMAGVAMALLALVVGTLVGLKAGAAVGTTAGIIALAAAFVILTMSGAGSRLAAAEVERREWSDARRYMDAVRDNRDRLATIRITDSDVRAMLQLAAERATRYLVACESAHSRAPLAEDALADCLSIADLYIKELDGASTERRYGLPDTDPFADARDRTLAALRDRIAILDKSILDLDGGLTSADRMEIKETL
ncbi:MAG TPA: hypothetical protein VMX33_06915 [bacterium]|nr:hypothetical protein [bacterium]